MAGVGAERPFAGCVVMERPLLAKRPVTEWRTTEFAPRLFSQFAAQQNGLQFVETKLKNSVYAWYFTEISVRKKEYGIA